MGATMGAKKRGKVRWKKPHLGPRLFVLPSQNVSASIQTTTEGGGANGCAVPQAGSFPSTSTRLGPSCPTSAMPQHTPLLPMRDQCTCVTHRPETLRCSTEYQSPRPHTYSK